MQSFMTHGKWIGERDPDRLANLRDAGRRLDEIRERLSVRLGPDSPLVGSLRAPMSIALRSFGRSVG
jgi:hypothetical protein